MKYKITLNGKTYEVEVEAGQAMLVDEYEAYAPAPALFSQNEPLEPAGDRHLHLVQSRQPLQQRHLLLLGQALVAQLRLQLLRQTID